MPYVSDSEMEDMIEKLKSEFGIAGKEVVTENSYAFEDKHKTMIEDMLFLKELEKESKGRLYTKQKWGFDKSWVFYIMKDIWEHTENIET